MGFFDSMMSAFGVRESLTDDQLQAVADALFCVMLADGEANEDEFNSLTSRLEGTPWFNGKSEGQMKGFFDRAVAKVNHMVASGAGQDALLQEFAAIGHRLGTGEVREAVFRMGVAVVCADGHVNDEERAVIGGFALGLGIDQARGRVIVAEEKSRVGLAH